MRFCFYFFIESLEAYKEGKSEGPEVGGLRASGVAGEGK